MTTKGYEGLGEVLYVNAEGQIAVLWPNRLVTLERHTSLFRLVNRNYEAFNEDTDDEDGDSDDGGYASVFAKTMGRTTVKNDGDSLWVAYDSGSDGEWETDADESSGSEEGVEGSEEVHRDWKDETCTGTEREEPGGRSDKGEVRTERNDVVVDDPF